MALSATTYTCHLKVVINGDPTEQEEVPVLVTNDNGSQLVGSVDECRLLDAVPSADWAKAEYDSMADSAFLTTGEAESYAAPVDLSAGITVSDVSYTNATVGVSVGALGSGAASASVLVQLAATSDFAAPLWATNYSVTATGLRTFPVAGLATNAAYFARALVTNNLDDAVAAGPFSFQTLSPGAPMASAAVRVVSWYISLITGVSSRNHSLVQGSEESHHQPSIP